VTKAVL